MTVDTIEVIGLIAACLTTSAFLPQVYKSWKTKNVEGVSLLMYLVFLVGVILWFVYGWYLKSLSILLANGVTSVLVIIQLVLRLRYGSRKNPV